MTTHLSTHADLPQWAVIVACVLAAASFVLLWVELRRRERGGVLVVLTGTIALAALLLTILRPVRVSANESVVGARVVVLADASRSMALPDPALGKTRQDARDKAIDALSHDAKNARLTVVGFGDGAPRALSKTDAL